MTLTDHARDWPPLGRTVDFILIISAERRQQAQATTAIVAAVDCLWFCPDAKSSVQVAILLRVTLFLRMLSLIPCTLEHRPAKQGRV